MFKSNFARNLAAFALLIFLSFSAITFISTFVVLDNARKDRIATSKRLADAVFDDIHDGLKTYNGSFTSTVLRIQNQITYSDRFAAILNSNIFITDKNGFILYSSTPAYRNAFRVEPEILKKYTSYPGETHCSTFGGIFESEYYVSAFPIDKENASSPDDIFGMVFICSPADSVIHTANQIVNLILTALFWVFLASVLALYFISERLNIPLMRLKEKFSVFSSGDYSVRMPKTGVTEVDLIGDAFNEMATILEVTENSRRMFLCNVSHDLRTPMTSIQGFTEAILDGTLPPERHHYYLVLIHKEIKRLSGMVNELLDISKIESGNMQLNKSVFDICEMVRLIVISLEEKLLSKNIEFHLEAKNSRSYVLADKDSIYQVIYNLLDNAAKFSDNNGTIRVTIFPETPEDTQKNTAAEAAETPKEAEQPIKPEEVSKKDKKNKKKQPENKQEDTGPKIPKYRISIYNTGIGIPQERIEQIFDRFYKIDMSRGLCRDGLGLGLFIVKTVMDRHGEPIEINSKEGEYCEFVFSLPLVSKPKKIAVFGLSDLPLSGVPSSFHFTSKDSEDAELYDLNDPLQPPLREDAEHLDFAALQKKSSDTPKASAKASETTDEPTDSAEPAEPTEPDDTTEPAETTETPDVSDTSASSDAQT